jgi:LysR family transcriptional activator of nhaA
VKKLEEGLGVALFEKRGRKLALTETGKVAYRYAGEIFGLGSEMREALRGQRPGGPLRLVVGISDVLPKLLVRHLLAPALAEAPAPTLVCREDRFDRLLADLAAHELDVVLADAPVPPGGAVRGVQPPARRVAGGGAGGAGVGPRAQARLPQEPRPGAGAGAARGSPLRRALNAWFARHQLAPRVVAEGEDSALLKEFAADGMGVLFVPTVIAELVAARYHVAVVGELAGVRDRYYAISVDRKLVHPAVVAIRDGAKGELFGAR